MNQTLSYMTNIFQQYRRLFILTLTVILSFTSSYNVLAGNVLASGEDHFEIFMWVANQSASDEAGERAKEHCQKYSRKAKFKSLEKNVYKYECVEIQNKLSKEEERLALKAKALNLIKEFARDSCKEVSDEYQQKTIQFSGEIAAELKGLAKKIADLKGGASGQVHIEKGKGIPQKELRVAFKDSNECHLEVLKQLKDELIPD